MAGTKGNGRPTKLTPEVQERIVAAVAGGNYFTAAAAVGGVTYDCMNVWMQRGKAESSGIYHHFFKAVTEAEAEAEARVVAAWQAQIPDNWPAARDFLARRNPDRWGPKSREEVTVRGDPEAPIAIISLIPPAPRMLREGGDDDA